MKIKRLIIAGIALSLLLLPLFHTTSQTGSLDGEALAQSRRFFSKMSVKCGNYYYYAYRQRRTIMYQCKYPPMISVDGQTYQPRRLSEADRLNGVDPLPIAWQGRAMINLGLCRRQVAGANGFGTDAWEPWLDKNSDAVPLTDKKGQWEFFNAPTGREAYDVKQVLPITCNDIPGAPRKSATRPPSWTGQYRGNPVLRLPANYGDWFLVGKGPLTLKLQHTYSWIAVDGTNNSRNPMGQAMYMGAKKTDPNALVPNAALGAVVVKIGKDGEPFQAFNDRGDPANDGLRIRENEDIFIAINDSNFADNRGVHVVVVEGGELNTNGDSGVAPASSGTSNETDASLLQALKAARYEYGWTGGASNAGSANVSYYGVTAMVINGDSCSMRYGWRGGVLEGKISGKSFSGTWRQSNGTGNFSLAFSSDFTTARGWWDDAATGEHGLAFMRRISPKDAR